MHYNENVLQIRRYDARLEGDDIPVLQDLTGTQCVFQDLSCILVEQPKSAIIWDEMYPASLSYHDF